MMSNPLCLELRRKSKQTLGEENPTNQSLFSLSINFEQLRIQPTCLE